MMTNTQLFLALIGVIIAQVSG
jgi:hypothetical protein